MTDGTARTIGAADRPRGVRPDQIADPWSALVPAALDQGPLRFGTIGRRLEGVTQTAFARTLRRRARNGTVECRVLRGSPGAVAYRVPPLGRTLDGPSRATDTWTEDHRPEAERARAAFDGRTAA